MVLHNIIWFVTIAGQRIFNLYPDKRGFKYCLFILYGGSTCRLHLRTCFTVCNSERDVAQWLERGALSMSLPAVRFRIPLGAGFSKKFHVSSLSIFWHCFDVVSMGKALNPQMLYFWNGPSDLHATTNKLEWRETGRDCLPRQRLYTVPDAAGI